MLTRNDKADGTLTLRAIAGALQNVRKILRDQSSTKPGDPFRPIHVIGDHTKVHTEAGNLGLRWCTGPGHTVGGHGALGGRGQGGGGGGGGGVEDMAVAQAVSPHDYGLS